MAEILSLPQTDISIVSDFDEAYNEAYRAWDGFYPLADRDLRFYLSDQWDEQEKRALYDEGRSTFVFNRARRNIQLVSGYQRKHRRSSIVVPLEGTDQQAADQLTKLLLYTFQNGDGYETISDCFNGALVTGWNLLSVWTDYRTDPVNGDICFGREPYNAFIADPYFYKKDFSDCAYILRRKYLSLPQAQSLLPGKEKELEMLWQKGWARDAKFTWLPYQRQPNGETLLAYNEYWVQGWEEKEVLYDTNTGIELQVEEGNKELLSFFPNLVSIKKQIPFVMQHIIINDYYMHSEKNPYGLNEYPFVPFFAIFYPESDQYSLKVQSLMRIMVDPQREANRRRSQMSDLIESQINSGWIATENSVINPESLFQTSQGKVIWRTRNAPAGSLEKIPPAQIPPSMFQLTELFDKDTMEVANISPALLGQADAEDSGLKVFFKQEAAQTGLEELFDNCNHSQEILSRKVLKMIQQWDSAKMKRVLGEDPVPALSNPDTLKYDIAVQEGVLTETQQQLFFRQLLALKELGEPIPPGLLVRSAPLQGKTEYLQAMQEFQQQQQQQEQEQAEGQKKFLQVQEDYTKAKIISDIAMASERFARAESNEGLEEERTSKTELNKADSTLRRVEAFEKLEKLDESKLRLLLEIVGRLDTYAQTNIEEIQTQGDTSPPQL